MITINELMWRFEDDAINFATEMNLPHYFESAQIDEICLDLKTKIARLHFKGEGFVRMSFISFKNVVSGLDRLEIHFTNSKRYDYHLAIFRDNRVAFVCESGHNVEEHDVNKQIAIFAYC